MAETTPIQDATDKVNQAVEGKLDGPWEEQGETDEEILRFEGQVMA